MKRINSALDLKHSVAGIWLVGPEVSHLEKKVSAIFALDDPPEKWHSYIEKNSNYVDGGKFQPDKYSTA